MVDASGLKALAELNEIPDEEALVGDVRLFEFRPKLFRAERSFMFDPRPVEL